MLTLKHITKKFKDKTALNDVSLELDPGIYGLLGPNGAGKSTLMNIITGNIRPTEGKVLWDGADIRELGGRFRSLIGYAPQQQGLYNSFSGRRFLSYMAALKGIPKKEVSSEIERVLSYVNLQEAADRAVGGYSGGMKQRILIAQAILGEPKLIVLDEPTAALDPLAEAEIYSKFNEIIEDKTAIYISHRLSSCRFCDEILVFDKGHIVQQGSHETLVSAIGGKYHELWHAQAQYYDNRENAPKENIF